MSEKIYAGVIVNYRDKMLFCKRNANMPYGGTWSIVGGGVEDGEKIKDAAAREFFEETSIEISKNDLEFIGIVPRYNRNGNKYKGKMFVFLMDVDKKIIPDLDLAIDGEEHTKCGYFTFEHIKRYDVDKNVMTLLKIYKNI